jgi:hypothetical protein
MEKMNCSIVARNKKQLQKAVEKMEKEIDGYTQNAEVLSKFSGKFNGLDRAVEIIENLQN